MSCENVELNVVILISEHAFIKCGVMSELMNIQSVMTMSSKITS